MSRYDTREPPCPSGDARPQSDPACAEQRGCCPGRRRQSLLLSFVLVCWASTPPAARCSSIHSRLGQLLLRDRGDPSQSSTAEHSGPTQQLPAAPPVTIREDKSLAVRLQPSLALARITLSCLHIEHGMVLSMRVCSRSHAAQPCLSAIPASYGGSRASSQSRCRHCALHVPSLFGTGPHVVPKLFVLPHHDESSSTRWSIVTLHAVMKHRLTRVLCSRCADPGDVLQGHVCEGYLGHGRGADGSAGQLPPHKQ